MSLKSDYNDFITYKDRLLCDKTTKYWINQEERYIEPFQIFGNLYYVGDTWVCVHIVDTGAGLLMLDAGNCGNTALLIESIWEMGFRPEDVKWIILSHGHADHFGAVGFFRRMYGTKIYMGEPDVRMFELEMLTSKENELVERTKIAENVYDMFRHGGDDDVREKLIDVMYENQRLQKENKSLKELLEKAYDFMKQFVIDGVNLLEKFMESVRKVMERLSPKTK